MQAHAAALHPFRRWHSRGLPDISALPRPGPKQAGQSGGPQRTLGRGILAVSPNTVHFAIRMAALKSTRVVGCGVRGRNG